MLSFSSSHIELITKLTLKLYEKSVENRTSSRQKKKKINFIGRMTTDIISKKDR